MSEAIIRENHFCSKILWFYNIESVKNTNSYSEICDTMIKMKYKITIAIRCVL